MPILKMMDFYGVSLFVSYVSRNYGINVISQKKNKKIKMRKIRNEFTDI